VADGGNVGIGTASPGSIDGQPLKLNVSGYAGFNGLRVGLDGSNDILADSANGLTIASKNAGAKMQFKTGGTAYIRMTIDANGRVGIGQTNPGEKLTVSGGNVKIDATQKFLIDSVEIKSGSGVPNNNDGAPKGSLFLRNDGGTSTTLYVKTGTNVWTAK